MSKSELKARLLNDQLTFLLAGGAITHCEPQKATTKHIVRGKETRSKAVGGGMPMSRISSTFA